MDICYYKSPAVKNSDAMYINETAPNAHQAYWATTYVLQAELLNESMPPARFAVRC